MAVFNGIYAAFTDSPWSNEIRFPDTEGYHIIHGIDQIEKFSYPAGGQ
jgi:hypothetical protein